MKHHINKLLKPLSVALIAWTLASCGTTNDRSELKSNSDKKTVRLPSRLTCSIARSPAVVEHVEIKLDAKAPVIRENGLSSLIVTGKEIEQGSYWEAYNNDDHTVTFGSPGCDYLTEFRFPIADIVAQKKNLNGVESFSIRDDKPTETPMDCVAIY
jgi:hypothetical protein